MKVHYLQHVDFEGPAYIESWCEQKHHEISGTRFFEVDYELPLLNSFDILIVLGGPMSVYDERDYPWLKREKDFISRCIAAGKKVVGICLGAQLAAVCLGVKVIKAANKEIGWFPVYPTENCLQMTWFYDLFSANPKVFHWHGETFQIPANSMDLLSSEANPNQAFLYKNQVLGLQFHLETTPQTVESMLNNCADELVNAEYIQPPEVLSGQLVQYTELNSIANCLLENFLQS